MTNNLLGCDSTTDHIYVCSGLSSTITGSFASPGAIPNALTYDILGSSMIHGDYDTDYIYVFSGVSSTITGSFGTPKSAINALGYDPNTGNLLSSDRSTYYIWTHSGISDTLLGSFALTEGRLDTITYDFIGSNLVTGRGDTDYIYVHNGLTSTVTGSFASPGAGLTGMAIDKEGNLITNCSTPDYIYTHLGVSTTLTGSFANFTGGISDIAMQTVGPPPPPQIFTKQFDDTITATDTFDISRITRTFTKSFSDIITLTDTFATEAKIPYAYEPVYTKIEIDGIAYADVPKITVDRTIGEFSATSNFTAEFNNFNGQYSDTFNLNDEVVIYADRGATPTTKIFTGIIEDINFKGDVEKERIVIVGRDYGAILQDMTVQPVIFKNEDAGVIAKQVMLNNTEELLTGNNMDTSTGTIIERIGFNHINVFSALQELAELSNSYFYVDTDKDVHFEAKSSTSSGKTFDNTNVHSAIFKKDDREIYNKIFVYGARVLTGANDTFAADGTGSIFTLNSKPHSTRVTSHDVLQQPGGIYEMTNPATETDLKYLVDFNEKKIIFVSGTAAGENIPASGTSPISVDYERFTPLLKYVEDDTSVTSYGPKTKIIKDDNLKSFSEVNERATTFLADNKDPKIQGDIDIKGVVDLTPGNTCVVDLPWHGISNQAYTILSAAYNFNKRNNRADRVLHITVNKKLSDFTDVMKEQMIKLKQFEVGPLEGEYTSLLTATRYADVDNHYELWQRNINNNFVFHSEKHGRIHDPNSRIGTGELGSTFIVSGGGF